MLRPPPPRPFEPVPSDDTGSFGGLAEVLEPDQEDAITSLRHLGVASVRNPPISVRHHGPISERGHLPLQVQDFAFADTVHANELAPGDEPAPGSGQPFTPRADAGQIYVNDAAGNTQCVTPFAFPLPPMSESTPFNTRARVRFAHVRHAFQRSCEEMRELWAGTAEMVGGNAGTFRRVLAFWSCFQWSKTDLVRAGMIGLAVFVTAAAIGATTLDFGEAAASDGVRATRTLDQHTGKKIVLRAKR